MYSTFLERKFVTMLYTQFVMVSFIFFLYSIQAGIIFYLYSKVHKINGVIDDWGHAYNELKPYIEVAEEVLREIKDQLNDTQR